MKAYLKRLRNLIAISTLPSLPIAIVMAYGGWSVREDMLTLNVPWEYWAYVLVSGLAVAYFNARYFDKPKE